MRMCKFVRRFFFLSFINKKKLSNIARIHHFLLFWSCEQKKKIGKYDSFQWEYSWVEMFFFLSFWIKTEACCSFKRNHYSINSKVFLPNFVVFMCISFDLMKLKCLPVGKQLSVLITVLSTKLNVSNVDLIEKKKENHVSSIKIEICLNYREDAIDHHIGNWFDLYWKLND